jgi:exopolysaccharide biosynthesis WecB/TagA/CpsF family protein
MALGDARREKETSRTVPEIGADSSKVTASQLRNDLAALYRIINNISVVETAKDEAELIARVTQTRAPLVISFVNQNTLNLAAKSPHFARCLMYSDILLRDGIGIALCMAALRRTSGHNMNGTDFIPRLLEAFAGQRVAIFGTADPWTTRAAAVLRQMGCDIVSTMDGFGPEEGYLAETVATKPDLIILGMGNPRQEVVAEFIASSTTRPLVIVNGGAIVDFLARRFQRAPLYIRRAHCEWAFRLLLEPKRLWRRYCLGGFSFAWRVFLLWALL